MYIFHLISASSPGHVVFLTLEDGKQIFDGGNIRYQKSNMLWGRGRFNVGNFRSNLPEVLL